LKLAWVDLVPFSPEIDKAFPLVVLHRCRFRQVVDGTTRIPTIPTTTTTTKVPVATTMDPTISATMGNTSVLNNNRGLKATIKDNPTEDLLLCFRHNSSLADTTHRTNSLYRRHGVRRHPSLTPARLNLLRVACLQSIIPVVHRMRITTRLVALCQARLIAAS
jgi:hypothetical protein